jgi:hypothetical protein
MRSTAAGVDDAFGDALMVEMVDFLAENLVFQKHRAACTRLQLILIVADRDAVVGGQYRMFVIRHLMGFAASAGVQGSVLGHDHPRLVRGSNGLKAQRVSASVN